MIRVLWIGLPVAAAPAWNNPWYVNDFAVDLSDAELFTLSRKYDALIFARIADTYTMRRSIETYKERFPHTLIVGLGMTQRQNRERQFFEAGGDEYVPFPQSLDGELVRLRLERLVLSHFTDEVFSFGDLKIDPPGKTVYVGEEAVVLQRNVFKVFYRLILMRHRFLSKEELVSAMYENPEYVAGSGIDHAVCIIRQRIDRRFGIETVRTLRKKGYGFVYNS